MFVADNVWVEDDNTDDDERQAKELNDDDEGDADEVEVFSSDSAQASRPKHSYGFHNLQYHNSCPKASLYFRLLNFAVEC
jgi:hypothetical protein